MSKILVLTEGYCGKMTANGLCAKSLVEGFEIKNHSVCVVSCDREEIKSTNNKNVVSVYRELKKKTRGTNKLFSIYNFAISILLHSIVPRYDKNLVKEIVEKSEKLIAENNIDKIVCVYFPLETLIAGFKLKRKHKNLKLVYYEVDSVADGIAGYVKRNKHILLGHRNFNSFLYGFADLILILKCHESFWRKEFKKYNKKVLITDLPLLKENTFKKSDNEKELVEFLYSGALDSNYRNPEKVLSCFNNIADKLNYRLCFYSKGCEQNIDIAIKENDKIEFCGYVEQSVLEKAIEKCTFFVNIGNKVSNSLPSKLISYISYGKPIIHFSLQKNDVCEEYLNKYPLSLIIPQDVKIENVVTDVLNFVEENKEKVVPFDKLMDLYSMNTPLYSTEMILNRLE